MAGLNECGSEIRWIQDLLEELKDRQLSTDFFLGLMHDLTDMMVEGEAAEEDIDLPPIQPGQVLYTTFHNFQTTVYCHCYQRFGSASIIFRMRIQVQVELYLECGSRSILHFRNQFYFCRTSTAPFYPQEMYSGCSCLALFNF